MEFFQVIQNRYSCRRYKNNPVPEELIEKILDVARRAPSAANRQPWRFIVVTLEETRKRLSEAYGKEWFVQAPVIIVACGLSQEGWKRSWDQKDFTCVDVAIAFDHLTLAAANEGLGTCWIGAFKEDAVKNILGIPAQVQVVAMTPLGVPDDANPQKPRKPLAEVLCREKWE